MLGLDNKIVSLTFNYSWVTLSLSFDHVNFDYQLNNDTYVECSRLSLNFILGQLVYDFKTWGFYLDFSDLDFTWTQLKTSVDRFTN